MLAVIENGVNVYNTVKYKKKAHQRTVVIVYCSVLKRQVSNDRELLKCPLFIFISNLMIIV